jgi:hypothetical protein
MLVGAAAIFVIGFPAGETIPREASDQVWLNLPARWDSTWYIGLASGGYRWDGAAGRFENIAFFPAYPLLVRTLARGFDLTSPAAWNWLGVLVSTATFALGLFTLERLAREHTEPARARWCMVLCACAPFAVFFGLPYTESLFLLGATSLLLCVERGHFVPAIIVGVVVGLTRPTAIVMSVALAVGLLAGGSQRPLLRTPRSALVAAWLAASSPLMGVAIFSAFTHGLTGHPLTWAMVQEGWGRATQNPVVALLGPIITLAGDPMHAILHAPHAILNALAGIAALALVWPISKRLGVVHGSVVLAGTVLPLTAGGVASLGRYTAVLFPIYIWMAAALPERSLRIVACLLAALQAVVAALFFTWRPMY